MKELTIIYLLGLNDRTNRLMERIQNVKNKKLQEEMNQMLHDMRDASATLMIFLDAYKGID